MAIENGDHEEVVISPLNTITIVDGSTFCVSDRLGNIHPSQAEGLYFEDARFLSLWSVHVNDELLEPLSVMQGEAYGAAFVGRVRPRRNRGESSTAMFCRRSLGRGLHNEFRLVNYSELERHFVVAIQIDADYSHVFDVRSGRNSIRGTRSRTIEDSMVHIRQLEGDLFRGTSVIFDQSFIAENDRVIFDVELGCGEEWTLHADLRFFLDGEFVEPSNWQADDTELLNPVTRMTRWRQRVPIIITDSSRLEVAVRQANEDLGKLHIFDRRLSSYPVVAAGSPWFMTLFGRDSILAAYMSLLVDPDIAIGTLDSLARLQGEHEDSDTQEQPGKILHELRRAPSNKLGFNKSNVYYGSIDSTPLFIMLMGELRRWGIAPSLVDRFLPHVDRAMKWIDEYGDLDGDGYVECAPRTDGDVTFYPTWKDSPSAIRYANGDQVEGPVAMAEVQAYVYGAFHARMWFAREAGEYDLAEKYHQRAINLKKAFNRDFWLEDRGYFAMGLDRDKRPVDVLASNMGHCLWTGLVDAEKASLVRDRLMSPEMFSGWGIRSLANTMGGFNPVGYQNGAVWPHDTILCAAGLRRYGFVDDMRVITGSLLDCAVASGGTLPELFSGFDRNVLPVPISYPTSCSPQAWSAASALMALRLLLGFDPAIPQGHLHISPELDEDVRFLRLEHVPLNGTRIAIEVEDGKVRVDGMTSEIEVVRRPRLAESNDGL